MPVAQDTNKKVPENSDSLTGGRHDAPPWILPFWHVVVSHLLKMPFFIERSSSLAMDQPRPSFFFCVCVFSVRVCISMPIAPRKKVI
uniref:Uncharacterized protein n=1 Tax=Setaria italica TaxID=4555 RepID=K3YB80_SETIT